MADSRANAGTKQGEPGIFVVPQSKKLLKKKSCQKDTEGARVGQMWSSFSIKKHNATD